MHVLINNAGTFQANRRHTEDGLETTFAVNYLAPFMLTHEPMELLEESSPSSMISVDSIAHLNAKVDWNNPARRKLVRWLPCIRIIEIGHCTIHLRAC